MKNVSTVKAQDLRLVVKYNISHQMKDLKYQLLFWWLAQCLKITEKVSFNIASEASYVYIYFEWTKINSKCQKWSILASF